MYGIYWYDLENGTAMPLYLYQCHFSGWPPDVEHESFRNSDQSEHIYKRGTKVPGHVQRLNELQS